MPTKLPAGEPTLDGLKTNWKAVLENTSEKYRKSAALAILRSAGVKPVSIEGNLVKLAFRFPIHMDKINEPENKRVTGEILSAYMGFPCQVIGVHEPEKDHLIKEAQKLGAELESVEEKV